ncbi:MAG: ACP S-malonyltransferase [Bacteroides sp. SM23_62_1]|nr:MAG: ACP S-malonyltransferase [Bacteroides sp. SM23_62_1]
MTAYIFPGQGAQFPGMGKDLYESHEIARTQFHRADEILGFDITSIMFEGTIEDLRQTRVTQPAIFLHSVILAQIIKNFHPAMVAGHSLGEFSALVANRALSFDDGLRLVYQRALAMQKACEAQPSTMAAILGLEDQVVEEVCRQIEEVVVPANYNSPGQVVISGSVKGIDLAVEELTKRGAKRAIKLSVGGAFHSPFMEPARLDLQKAIESTIFNEPVCPVYQNVNAEPFTEPHKIKANLIAQLTAPVQWTQTIRNMIRDGGNEFIEVGPGTVLQGLVKKIDPTVSATGA